MSINDAWFPIGAGLLDDEEFVVTNDGCQISRANDYHAIYYPNPPAGEGWEEVGAAAPDANGDLRRLWWRRRPLVG